MADMTLTAGQAPMVELERGLQSLTPDGRGGFYLNIGRSNKTKHVWLSAAEAAMLPVTVKAGLAAGVTVTQAPKPDAPLAQPSAAEKRRAAAAAKKAAATS
jgi:hypothetical protein